VAAHARGTGQLGGHEALKQQFPLDDAQYRRRAVSTTVGGDQSIRGARANQMAESLGQNGLCEGNAL
jgi:hypothetical protein